MRNLTMIDHLLAQVDQGLRAVGGASVAEREYPGTEFAESLMSETERQHAGGLMRVNHVGEVCAQALYHGQAIVARDPVVRAHLLAAADEEGDHLAWCNQRLAELNERPSYLNGLWYAGSFSIGLIAGLASDAISLGFVHETEAQVEAHLNEHLSQLPAADERSRAVVGQMAEDEARHGAAAMAAGGEPVSQTVKDLMTMAAGVMKRVAYRI